MHNSKLNCRAVRNQRDALYSIVWKLEMAN